MPVFCYVHPSLANETFTINPDVYFTVDTTVINGHRICKLKSLKIHYHGDIFEMKVGSRTARADYTELYTAFEILIHILSKGFITSNHNYCPFHQPKSSMQLKKVME